LVLVKFPKDMCRPLTPFVLVIFGLVVSMAAGQNPSSSCSITPIGVNREPNMFTPAQEVELGEVLVQVARDNAEEVDDPELTAYLQQIGDRLASHLPPLGLKYRFYLSNLPTANAFSIAGGRVYVTRKLIGFAHSEDELAGVLAHELGHIVTHQSAIEYTRFFHAIGITEISDQADIESKFHRFLESGKRFTVSGEDRQLEADRVGMEVQALAGYKTDGLADFFDRATDNRGKTGNWFSDLLGKTPENSKRVREMQKTLRRFPPECADASAPSSESFREWQAKVVSYAGTGRRENIPGLLSRKELDPPLQDEVHTLRFSYDGKYLVAQDDGSIYVLTREPLAFKFRIEAPDAYPARFSADSKRLTFYDPALRVETWDLDKGERTEVHEMYSPRGCMQTALTSDGATLACVNFEETLVLFDTAKDERIFEKQRIRSGELAIGANWASYSYQIRFLNMGFSLDGRYLVLATGDSVLAVDVPARREIPVSGALKPFLHGAFSFVTDKTLVGNEKNGSRAALLSFPEGTILHSFELGSSAPFPVAKGEYVLMRPIRDYAVGVLDMRTNTIVRASKTPAMDVYGDIAASMLPSGELALFGAAPAPIAKLALPRGHFGRLQIADFSDDLNWLAVSTHSRGSVWNLSKGERPYNLKGFRGACFAKDGNLYLDFPKRDKVDRSIVRADLRQVQMSIVEKVDPGRVWQECQYLVSLRGKEETVSPKDKDKQNDDAEDEDRRDYRYEGKKISWRDVYEPGETNKTLEVRDALTDTPIWSKTFSKVIPAIYTDATSNVAAFRWRLSSQGARAELKSLPGALTPESGGRDDDYLIEIVELSSGKFLNAIVIDTTNGAIKLHKNLVTRDWVVGYDSIGRTLVYSLKTGKCTAKFFGEPRNVSSSGTLVFEHNPRRLAIYDLTSNKKSDLTFPFPVSSTFFTRDGKRLLLLTKDQVVYTVDPGLAK